MEITNNDKALFQKYLEATMLAKAGSYDDALEMINELIALDMKPEYLLLKGKILVKLERLQEAIETFGEIKGPEPVFLEAHKASLTLKKFLNGNVTLLSRVENFASKMSNLLLLAIGVLASILMIVIISWNIALTRAIKNISDKSDVSNVGIMDKMNVLDDRLKNTTMNLVKIDSSMSAMKDTLIMRVDSETNSIKTNSIQLLEELRKLKVQVDSISH